MTIGEGESVSPSSNRHSIRMALADAAKRLSEAGVGSPRLDARVLLAHALGMRSDSVFAADRIGEARLRTFESLIVRRLAREPVAYILGEKEFYSLAFEVGPGVLIPRPETETLLDEAMREFENPAASLRVLDLGTGSGCLIVAFLNAYRHGTGIGVDASPDALLWAQRNVERHDLSGRCTLVRGDWNMGGTFDVIFANPPYLTEDEFRHTATEIANYEPEAAFVAGRDGLAHYRALGPAVARALTGEGRAFMEIGAGQADAVAGILEASGLDVRRIVADLAGIPRCIVSARRR